jgi:hypothetical protein
MGIRDIFVIENQKLFYLDIVLGESGQGYQIFVLVPEIYFSNISSSSQDLGHNCLSLAKLAFASSSLPSSTNSSP